MAPSELLVRDESPFLRRKPLPDNTATETTALLHGTTNDGGTTVSDQDPNSANVVPLERHLSLFDLTIIGVGATIGSGLFVLCGFVAKTYAGPATALSWAISGFAACTSGICYAELSARVPAAGSTYAYAFVSMGELPALIAAACLSVEYIMTAAAVARSWAGKLIHYLVFKEDVTTAEDFSPSHLFGFSPLAFCVATACVLMLMGGIKESKTVSNVVTVTKVAVVFYMIIGGFFFLRTQNWEPFIPPQYGIAGVFRGATASFFGYIGYDDVACLAGEAKNPKRNLPLAILGTLIFVTVVYTVSAFSLTGMQPYQDISSISGFPAAFNYNNAGFSAQVTALGELGTLPIVVLLLIMAQPRLLYALAEDGLVPHWFGVLDSRGNLWNSTVFAGTIMVFCATFIPFAHLNDMSSFAVLLALSMTDTSLVLLWYDSPKESPFLADIIMLAFHGACLIFGVSQTHFGHALAGKIVAGMAAIAMLSLTVCLVVRCERNTVFGGQYRHPSSIVRGHNKEGNKEDNDGDDDDDNDGYFRTPWVPYLPCFAIFVNWYLIAQLHIIGIFGMLAFLGLTCLYYFLYAAQHSVGGQTRS